MRLSDWEQRKLDERDWPGGPAVGGITWTTCLAPTPTGPCLKGVPVSVHGEPTGRTKCGEHGEGALKFRMVVDEAMRAAAAEDERRAWDALLTLIAEDAEHGASRPRRLVMVRYANRPMDGAVPRLEPGLGGVA